ncbi:MAG: hypothetical protein GC204_07295 [Chloroflexi bacterium]|nr:hypothetical protein [Chloroflexota bacterium]
MKLAEALILRADAQKRIQQLRERLARSARIQEGDTAPENPMELLDEATRVIADLRGLVKQINRTNAQTAFDENRTLTDALADRDALSAEHSILTNLLAQAAGQGQQQYGYTTIKYFRTIDVGAVQKRADDAARRFRELDSRVQALNWAVDLIE